MYAVCILALPILTNKTARTNRMRICTQMYSMLLLITHFYGVCLCIAYIFRVSLFQAVLFFSFLPSYCFPLCVHGIFSLFFQVSCSIIIIVILSLIIMRHITLSHYAVWARWIVDDFHFFAQFATTIQFAIGWILCRCLRRQYNATLFSIVQPL